MEESMLEPSCQDNRLAFGGYHQNDEGFDIFYLLSNDDRSV